MKKFSNFVNVLRDIMFIVSVISRIFRAYQRWEERKILKERGYIRQEFRTGRNYNRTRMGFTAEYD